MTPPAGALTEPCSRLLHLNGGAGIHEFLPDRLGFVLVDAFLYGLRGSVDQVLGFFQAQTGHFTYDLDNIDFIGAYGRKNHRKLGFLFHRGSRRAACRAASPARMNASALA